MLYFQQWMKQNLQIHLLKWMNVLEIHDFNKKKIQHSDSSTCLSSLAFSPFKTPVMDGCIQAAASPQWLISPQSLDLTRSQVKNEPFVTSSQILCRRTLMVSFVFSSKTLSSPWIWLLWEPGADIYLMKGSEILATDWFLRYANKWMQ